MAIESVPGGTLLDLIKANNKNGTYLSDEECSKAIYGLLKAVQWI